MKYSILEHLITNLYDHEFTFVNVKVKCESCSQLPTHSYIFWSLYGMTVCIHNDSQDRNNKDNHGHA